MSTIGSNNRSLVLRRGEVLIAVPDLDDGEEVTRYFVDGGIEEVEDDGDDPIADARTLAGAWSHLDWDEMEAALDRIRHESKPTPPIEDL